MMQTANSDGIYTAGPTPKRISATDVAIYVIAPSCFAWWSLGGVQAWVCCAAAAVILLAVKSYLWHRGCKAGFESAKRQLAESGFNVDLEMAPNFAIDRRRRRIAFVDIAAGKYEVFSIDEVTSCEHSWSSYANVAGATTRGVHRLVFKTRKSENGEVQAFTFPISDHGLGDHWRRTINAL